ncbi:MAG: alpha/beta family hydrolase [Chloroherpetonaceae bacterium]|nr:alpha/beta family hydrolase [Chloroherpetonaceae bacterium]
MSTGQPLNKTPDQTPSQSLSQPLMIEGDAGKLEAILNPAERPKFLAVVCHPHPLYQGTMHNKVAVTIARALVETGGAVLRFNFRGVMQSEGTYDHGNGEIRDAERAIEFMLMTYRKFDVPFILAGFSFGAWVGLRHGAANTHVSHLIGLGVPMRLFDPEREMVNLTTCTKPKFLLCGERDEFSPMEKLKPFLDSVAEPKTVEIMPDADHFFTGRQHEVKALIETWVKNYV